MSSAGSASLKPSWHECGSVRSLALPLALAVALAGCNGLVPGGGGGLGSGARELVDPRLHANLVVEIDYPPGAGPNADAKAHLRSTLAEVTGRDASRIEFVEEAEVPAQSSKKYTLNDIIALETEHRDRRTSGDTAVLYVLYVAGGYSADDGDSRVLGVAYGGTSFAMFKGNIQSATRSQVIGGVFVPTIEERCIERAVLVHEFGHVAGLVNVGTPMVRPHEDPEHPGHSSNQRSVMYHAVENTVDLFSFFTGGCSDIPYQFDADDKADLAALRR